MVELEEVLHHYGVHPIKHMLITKNVHYIFDGKNEFALKKSALTWDSLLKWINVFHQADQLNIPGILPIYLTKNNELYCQLNETVYYLTPWIQSVDTQLNLDHVFKQLGQIHSQTKYYQTISNEKVETDFKTYLSFIEENQQMLHASIEQFEKNKFMSPLELQVCTHYISLTQVIRALKDFVHRFLDKLEEQTTWNVSLCHGDLRQEHILQTNYLYFINWEKTSFNHAVIDLDIFLKNMVTQHSSAEKLIEKIDVYMEENELNFAELYLLAVYLLDVNKYLSILHRYLKRNKNEHKSDSIIQQIILLQQNHRQLMFGLQFAEFINQKESESLLDDLES